MSTTNFVRRVASTITRSKWPVTLARLLIQAVASGCGVFFGAADATLAADPIGWKPSKTFVFAVGILEWEREDLWRSFPDAVPNRRDAQLVQHFREAGVPDEHIVYLQDKAATKHEIKRRFVELLDETDTGDLLIFYYAGHGYRNATNGKTWFANYDAADRMNSGWSVANIFQTIDEHFSGDRVIVVADCCHSGALYDEVQARTDEEVGFCALTSSYSHNASTGAWTFTDSLLKSLRGRPNIDYDRDGDVDLEETARFIEGEMAFIEEQKSMFIARGRLRGDTVVAKTMGKAKPKGGDHCEAFSDDAWYKAEILQYDEAAKKYEVHYCGFSSEYDEWLPASRVRGYQPRAYAVGTAVQGCSDGEWYPARVLRSWYGLHLLRYDGYDATWDEWLGPSAVRPHAEPF